MSTAGGDQPIICESTKHLRGGLLAYSKILSDKRWGDPRLITVGAKGEEVLLRR
jgi:hypothetical protein